MVPLPRLTGPQLRSFVQIKPGVSPKCKKSTSGCKIFSPLKRVLISKGRRELLSLQNLYDRELKGVLVLVDCIVDGGNLS